MNIVETEKAATATGPTPEANMWCAHTPHPINPIAIPEKTMKGYPNMGFLLNVGIISDMTPKLGRIRTYTSGCPKIQNKCCQSSGSAPSATLKKFAPNSRSKVSKNSATEITGIANSRSSWTMKSIHVRMGIFMSVIPGALIFRTVTMRLIAPTREAIPVIWRPIAKKSMPLLGEKRTPVLGEYANHPPSGEFSHHPPMNMEDSRNSPPPRNTQKLKAFSLGKATSLAPICKGIK